MEFHLFSALGGYARVYVRKIVRRAGMSETEHRICSLLFGASDLPQDSVAVQLVRDKTTIAKALSTLERKGFVRRVTDPLDRRRNLLSITEKGRAVVSGIVGVYDDWLAKVSACLSEQEKSNLQEYCGRMMKAAKTLGK